MDKMMIVSGVSSLETLKSRVQNGVGEVFLGYIDDSWYQDYGYLISPNRRWGKQANFSSATELEQAILYAHQYSVKISLALNAHRYTDRELEKIFLILDQIMPLGIDNIIVSDYTMIESIKVKFPNVKIHISTGGVVFNSMAVQFYKSLGADRIIFPRSLSAEEIIEISKEDSELEYEVFISGSRCANIDGLCNFEHSIMSIGEQSFDNYPMCSLKYQFSIRSTKNIGMKEKERLTRYIKERFRFNSYPKACAACYLYDFYKAGICFIKIPARAMYSSENKKIVNDETSFINHCIQIIDQFSSAFEYKNYVRAKYEECFKEICYEYCERCYY